MAGGLASIMVGAPVPKKKSLRKRLEELINSLGLHGGLIFMCVIYVCVGALLFRSLERQYELNVKNRTLTRLEEMREELIEKAEKMRASIQDDDEFEQAASVLMENFTAELFEIFKHPIASNVMDSVAYNQPYLDLWTFPSAVLFTSTTMVPVGFGLVTPLTWEGRLFLVCYALIGIPLALVTMSDMGRFLVDYIGSLFGEERTNAFLVTLLSSVIAYPLLGGLIISHVADLDITDGIYYSSITILTVGFGDMSPPIPIPLLIAYIIFGVMLVTISIEVVASNAIHHIHFMGRQLGHARVLANRMVKMAQKISISKGLGMGMAQLGAFARIGMMKYEVNGRRSSSLPSMFHSSLRSPLDTAPFDPPMRIKWIDWPADFYTIHYDMDHPFIDDPDVEDSPRQTIPGDSLSDFIIKTSLSPMDEHCAQEFI